MKSLFLLIEIGSISPSSNGSFSIKSPDKIALPSCISSIDLPGFDCTTDNNGIVFMDDEYVSNISFRFNRKSFSFGSDTFSRRTLFYFKNHKIFCLSSSLDRLVSCLSSFSIDVGINPNALQQLVHSAYIYQYSGSPLASIKKVEPDLEITLDYDSFSLSVSPISSIRLRDKEAFSSVRDASRAVQDILITRLQRIAGKRTAIMMSGGLDSRLILLLSLSAGLRPDLLVFGQSTSNYSDFASVGYISNKLDLDLKIFRVDPLNILRNPDFFCASNYSNLWNLHKVPIDFFDSVLPSYDYILRGDGDGLFGWKNGAGSMDDLLHQLEIDSYSSVSGVFPKVGLSNLIGLPDAHQFFIRTRQETRSLRNSGDFYRTYRFDCLISNHVSCLNHYSSVYNPLLDAYSLTKKFPKYMLRDKLVLRDLVLLLEEKYDFDFPKDVVVGSWNNHLDDFISGFRAKMLKTCFEALRIDLGTIIASPVSSSPSKQSLRAKFLSKLAKNRLFRIISCIVGFKPYTPSIRYDSGYRFYALASLLGRIRGQY